MPGLKRDENRNLLRRRGLQLSFGMIFSIIIIIAIISVAFYALGFFFDTRNCSEIALFHEDFQKRIDRVWNSEIARDSFEPRISGRIEQVCFGDDSFSGSGEVYESFDDNYPRSFEPNLFLYPPDKACNQAYREIEHISLQELGGQFTCFPVENGKVSIKIEKESFDPSGRILPK